MKGPPSGAEVLAPYDDVMRSHHVQHHLPSASAASQMVQQAFKLLGDGQLYRIVAAEGCAATVGGASISTANPAHRLQLGDLFVVDLKEKRQGTVWGR